ncbi:MAG: hypothetical protein ACI9CD_000468 [Candidatus Deianiraeaceae bacterium]
MEIIFGLKVVDASNIDQRYRERYIGNDGFLKREYIENFCNDDVLTLYDSIQQSTEQDDKKGWIAQLGDPRTLDAVNEYYRINKEDQICTQEIQRVQENIQRIEGNIKQHNKGVANYNIRPEIRKQLIYSEKQKINALESALRITRDDLQYYKNFNEKYNLLDDNAKKIFMRHITSKKPNQLVDNKFQEVLSTYYVIHDSQKILNINRLQAYINDLEGKEDNIKYNLNEMYKHNNALYEKKLQEEDNEKNTQRTSHPMARQGNLREQRDDLREQQGSQSVHNTDVQQSCIWDNMLKARANLCFHKIMHRICEFTADDQKIMNDDPHFYDNGSDLYNKIQQEKINIPTIKKEKTSKDQCQEIYLTITESLKDMPLMYPLYFDEQVDEEYKDLTCCRELGLYLSYASDRLQTGIDDSCVKSIITFNDLTQTDNKYLYEQGIGRASYFKALCQSPHLK